ncbi:MAG TPA: TonB-dependent receptor [Bacteroidales bacterium]|nr:TonB-dependent receptor [Bacteroidales bacterium]
MKKTIQCFLALVAIMFLSVGAYAQVTTSSLGGRITDETGAPAVGVTVVATHVPSGTMYAAVTNIDGRYTVQGMRTGGPYTVEISYVGYKTMNFTDITLQLGDLYNLSTDLQEEAVQLEDIVIVASASSAFAGEKFGSSTNISNRNIQELPTISRSITDVAKLSPYGGNGMSFAGGDGRSSNFTVDGANFNNNFGLSSSLPGGGTPISIDAIEEVQVVIAPFDVRQTNFIGGGVNAITKSGTNTLRGSAYAYHRNENMRGNNIDGVELGDRGIDRNTTYGLTLGGPIVKNKLFFFVNFEYTQTPTIVNRWRPSEDGVANTDLYISRTTMADMKRVSDFLSSKYGYDTGSYTDYPADESNMKILARLDWNISQNHNLAVRYNYTLNRGWNNTNASSSNVIQRTTESRLGQYSMAFANSMYSMDNVVNSVSVDLNSRFGDNVSNQLLVTYSQLDDIRGSSSAKFPFIDIMDGYTLENGKIIQNVMPYMSAGYELFTWNNGVHNTVINAKDDITIFKGNHKITAGLSFEYQMADNSYMRNGTGYYRYHSMDDFLNGAAPESVCLTYGYDGELNPAARVRFNQFGLYAQDEWSIGNDFKLTYGVRLDEIIFNNKDLMRNNAIYDIEYDGKKIDTGMWPKPKLQISPRVGFTWDVLGNRSLKVRGGTGLFSGRLPLVFFTNMPTNSGMVQNIASISTRYSGGVANPDPLLEAFKGDMITDVDELIAKLHSLDPDKFPTSISPEDGVKPSQINGIDPDFRMPQVWKTSIALDYNFPTSFPFSISGEYIFNKTINGICLTNWNIKNNAGFTTLNGPDKRHIYPDEYRLTNTDAYVLSNTKQGYGWTANFTLNMNPVKNLYIMASYTHTAMKQITGMPGSNAESAYLYIPTVEGPNFAGLSNSQYVTPDRVIASISYKDNSNNRFSLFYEGYRGGSSYTYMYNGDFNGDNIAYDVMYIPKDDTEIIFASQDDRDRYWAYAEQDAYLSKNKGSYAEAYSVYSPWVHRFDFRYSHDFVVNVGKSRNTLQLNFDLMNAGNLFNNTWGVSKILSTEAMSGRILQMDSINEEGIPVFKTRVQEGARTWDYSHSIYQCWSLQIGIKYLFN